ncbi:hypothetical protein HUG17_8960 [Dermatophagoides farinae]|uniref:PDZ domain-containing protein n=1 Tax=Dermatophagoides farinae TaxID=6954 RepID=A0A9D4NRR3_DERFA|nr:dendritic arbor reduction protein 1-like [Dermatophagoides farinae]KAH7637856.1 hypothetical protein HUG17_8960 [Dermatophagoides farinae]
MPPFKKPTLVTLRRQNPSQAWGFRLGGGAEIGQPFQIQKVTSDSLAYLGGLSEGDELVRIGNISLRGLTHDEVQQIILRCTHCIDLFILRDDGRDVEPRIERNTEIISERSDVPYMERPAHFPPVPFKPPIYSHQHQQQQHQQQQQQQLQQQQQPNQIMSRDNQNVIRSTQVQMQMMVPPTMQNGNQAIHSPQSFNSRSPDSSIGQFKPIQSPEPNNNNTIFRSDEQQQQQQLLRPEATQPGQPRKDVRVFGLNPRSPSKSPNRLQLNHSISLTTPSSPAFPQQTQQQQQQPMQQQSRQVTQSTPSTPTIGSNFDFNDSNNNPIRVDPNKKIFGLPNTNRIMVKSIVPIGNHGIQPVNNEKKYFGVNHRQRFNSISSDRDWKDPLPIVNIPNVDQLLPSQTRQMQTYINQTPPTIKNLRPSLSGIERRKIRPVWPPPVPNVHKGAYVEGRDSPHNQEYAWPPSRAQSVDRDFGYGDRPNSPFVNYGRVRSSTRIWPPPSNSTPAGRSGFIPDENDDINYAYNPSRESSPAPGWISSHVPITYRTPPGTQYIAQTELIKDF